MEQATVLLEKISLINAVGLLGILVYLHFTFVNPIPDSKCMSMVFGGNLNSLHEYDVIRLHLSNEDYSCITSTSSNHIKNEFQNQSIICDPSESITLDQIYSSPQHKCTESDRVRQRVHLFEKFVGLLGLHYDDSPRGKLAVESLGQGLNFFGWESSPVKGSEVGEDDSPSSHLSEHSSSAASPQRKWWRSYLNFKWKSDSISKPELCHRVNTEPSPPTFPFATNQVKHASAQSQKEFWNKAVADAQLFDVFLSERMYLFSRDKGFLMLKAEIREKHNITRLDVTVPKHGCGQAASDCFGIGFIAWLVHNVVGYDTLVMNWMISRFGGEGYLYNVYSKELYNLNLATDFRESTGRANRVLMFKAGVLFTTLFLFFTTTTLVSFTLRETQERMLKFTYLLQHHVRHNIPYAPLVLTHVVESLVFVPIMVGILFFLFEFFSDQLLAFMVLSLVWMAEVFSVVSVRTQQSVRLFPRIFFLYFCIFHFYFFSFPFGFSYVALFTTILFLQHSMLYCWNNYEVPALLEGYVSAIRPRATSAAIPWATPNSIASSDPSGTSQSPLGSPRLFSAPQSSRGEGSVATPPLPLSLASHVDLSRSIQRQEMLSTVLSLHYPPVYDHHVNQSHRAHNDYDRSNIDPPVLTNSPRLPESRTTRDRSFRSATQSAPGSPSRNFVLPTDTMPLLAVSDFPQGRDLLQPRSLSNRALRSNYGRASLNSRSPEENRMVAATSSNRSHQQHRLQMQSNRSAQLAESNTNRNILSELQVPDEYGNYADIDSSLVVGEFGGVSQYLETSPKSSSLQVSKSHVRRNSDSSRSLSDANQKNGLNDVDVGQARVIPNSGRRYTVGHIGDQQIVQGTPNMESMPAGAESGLSPREDRLGVNPNRTNENRSKFTMFGPVS